MQARIVITGFGGLTAVGDDMSATWEAIKQGKSGIGEINLWDASSWEYKLGGELKNYQPQKMIRDRKLLKMLSRHDVIGLNAAQQAMDHSGLIAYRETLADVENFKDRSGIYVASPGIKFNQQYDLMPLFTHADGDIKRFAAGIFDIVHPMWLLRILTNNVLAYAGIEFGFKGSNQNFTNHVVSGIQALGEASAAIKSGWIDRALVIGYEAALEPQAQGYYAEMGLLSKTGLTPFDENRDGTILAEGAGAIVLESLESAQKRNAIIYGEILADSMASEAMGIFSLRADGDGVSRAIKKVMQRAELKEEDLGLITAHANGTKQSDSSEAAALQASFNKKIPITGFKWSLGHTLAATGVIEAILTLFALREQIAPGIASLTNQAKDCADISISNETQPIHSPYGLMINRGFASLNACLLLSAKV